MKIKNPFQRLNYILLTSFLLTKSFCNAETKDDCIEIQNYLIEKDLTYDNVIKTCKVDDKGNVVDIYINDECLSDEVINQLLSYEKINTLYYVKNKIENCVYTVPTQIANMENLEDLTIFQSNGEFDFNLFKNSSIKKLYINGLSLTDQNVEQIANSMTKLEYFNFVNAVYENLNVAPLKNLKNLSTLTPNIDNIKLESIRGFTNVKKMELVSDIVNEAIVELSTISSLEYLDIFDVSTGEMDLSPLQNLSNLST
eukprot:jgi/Orpsp1_1/1190961/evm.model.d7180000082480.1